ncbi:aldehyde dehydrogenase family protein [Streptomyces cavernae]|uniref:aldehyde dehydrogenase family protein n=1 Tax=Streptomyces cavernae TaxID=2259034 RepID=UPI000FEBA1C1|nr:aldehyde dehydrogenase family protein [Streptomyces cavernae]
MTARLRYDRLYINGQWTAPLGRDRITVISPVTEAPIGSCPAGSPADIDAAVTAARDAFDYGTWPRMTVAERAEVLQRMARLYADGAAEAANLITLEMGAPARFTAQTEHPKQIFDYYLQLAASGRDLFTEHRDQHTITREPVGVCALITPWNMPHKTILMKAVPALLAGCTLVIKAAVWSPLSALWLAQLADDAGLPAGVFNVVPARPDAAGHLVTHPGIDKIAFTGSTATGIRIASLAGRNLTRVSLELGGKSAMVVLDDADVEAAVDSVLDNSLACSGQICSNQTRILVARPLYAQVCGALYELLAARLTVGDPADPSTQIGPLVSATQLERARAAVHAHDVAPVTGGYRPARPGWFLKPALFTDVDPTAALFRNEVFAPVLAVTPFDTDLQAVDLANATPYGLDGSVWSASPDRAHAVAAGIRTGMIHINGAPHPISAPIGGFKASGIGRELGPDGLHAFTEVKATITGPRAAAAVPAGAHRGETGAW